MIERNLRVEVQLHIGWIEGGLCALLPHYLYERLASVLILHRTFKIQNTMDSHSEQCVHSTDMRSYLDPPIHNSSSYELRATQSKHPPQHTRTRDKTSAYKAKLVQSRPESSLKRTDESTTSLTLHAPSVRPEWCAGKYLCPSFRFFSCGACRCSPIIADSCPSAHRWRGEPMRRGGSDDARRTAPGRSGSSRLLRTG